MSPRRIAPALGALSLRTPARSPPAIDFTLSTAFLTITVSHLTITVSQKAFAPARLECWAHVPVP